MEKKTILEGNFNAEGLKFGIVCARFNNFFVSHLLTGAVDSIVRQYFPRDKGSMLPPAASEESPAPHRSLRDKSQ